MKIKSPGEMISQDILGPMNVRPSAFATAMGMSPAAISRLLSGKAAISPETAIRLEAVLDEKAEYWMGLQAAHDIRVARDYVDVSLLKRLEAQPSLARARSMLNDLYFVHNENKKPVSPDKLKFIRDYCGVDILHTLMRQVDPERAVFDFPITLVDKGVHGLPFFANMFTDCSNMYGHVIDDGEGRIPLDFIEAASCTPGLLNERTLIVWNHFRNTHGLLVIAVSHAFLKPVQADMDAMAMELGVDVACYAEPAQGDSGPRALLTAFVEQECSFIKIPEIFRMLSDIVEKWRLSHKNVFLEK